MSCRPAALEKRIKLLEPALDDIFQPYEEMICEDRPLYRLLDFLKGLIVLITPIVAIFSLAYALNRCCGPLHFQKCIWS